MNTGVVMSKIAVKYGALPEGWRKIKLGQISKFTKGNGITKNELVTKGVPCVRYGELYTKHNFRIQKFYSFISKNNFGKQKLIKNNDLLFAGSGETREEIGKCSSFNLSIPAYAGGDVIVCSIDAKVLRADFASYYLNTIGRRQLNKLGQGDSIVHIYSRFLESVEIPVPPLPEQKAIVSMLETWDTAIETTESLIATKQKRFEWLLKTLISDQQNNPIWKEVKLNQISTCYSGGTPSTQVPQYYDGNISFITSSDLNQRRISSVKGKLSVLGIENSSAKFVKKNTLLIALYGATAGTVAITHIEAVINQAVLAIVINEDHCNNFIFFNLEKIKDVLIKKYRQGGQPNLSAQIIKSIKLRLPPLSKQKQIAHVLNTTQHEIKLLKEITEQYRRQKRGLMHKLLTGKLKINT